MKKVKINPYLKHLLKENAGYILVFIVLLFATFFFISLLIGKFSENQSKISSLKKEIAELQDKQNLLVAATSQNPKSLDDDIKIMQRLIPDAEDYFSILYSLEELSQKTGLSINSYSINLGKSSVGRLSLTVAGIGNIDSFLNFLKEYNVGGGRLITTEKIELDSHKSDSFKLNLTFYTKKVTGQEEKNLNYRDALEKFQILKNKISFVIREEDEIIEAYPIKTSPF